jgi:hypothetical protein
MVVGDQRKYLTCLLTLKVGSNITVNPFFILHKYQKKYCLILTEIGLTYNIYSDVLL